MAFGSKLCFRWALILYEGEELEGRKGREKRLSSACNCAGLGTFTRYYLIPAPFQCWPHRWKNRCVGEERRPSTHLGSIAGPRKSIGEKVYKCVNFKYYLLGSTQRKKKKRARIPSNGEI